MEWLFIIASVLIIVAAVFTLAYFIVEYRAKTARRRRNYRKVNEWWEIRSD